MAIKTWQQLIAIPNGTRVYNHYFDQCVALANLYHENVLGGKFVPVQSAFQWWSNTYPEVNDIYTKSGTPVAGALVVWNGNWGAGHGHIGIVTAVNANGTFTTLEQNAETWRYTGRYTRGLSNVLGFLIPKKNPAGGTLLPHQRQVGANPVKRRTSWTSQSKEEQPPLAAHGIADFRGWRRGEHVNDGIKSTNIWYLGAHSDNWFWAGGFTSQSTAGLTDMNPKEPPAPTPTPTPTPEPAPEPVPDVGPGPVLAAIEGWNKLSAPEFGTTWMTRPKRVLARPSLLPDGHIRRTDLAEGGFYFGRKGAPNHFVIHHGAQSNLESLVNTLRGRGNTAPTTHFVVGDKSLISMVDTGDTASTNGRWMSNVYGINYELKNHGSTTGKPSADTHMTTAYSMAEEALAWGFTLPLQVGVNVFGHKDVSKSATACPGDTDLYVITRQANELIEAFQAKEMPSVVAPSDRLADSIDRLIALLEKIFKIGA